MKINSLIEQIKKLNGKSGMIIKIYLIISLIFISVSVIVLMVNTINWYFSQNDVYDELINVLNVPIKDELVLSNIKRKLNQENILFWMTSNGIIKVENSKTAKKVISIIKEDLRPIPIDNLDIIYKEKTPRNIVGKDNLVLKYWEMIFKYLQSTFTKDRIRDLEVTWEDINDENPIGSNDYRIDYRIIVKVNIDGKYKLKYNENNKFVILPDGSREREYEPISFSDLRNIETHIRDMIGYSSERKDSVIVMNIPFDRTKQFAVEDTIYFRQQIIKIILSFFIICLVVISFIFNLIFLLKYHKKK
jgi:flagellar biosynthesis/type III secretory pathway M-ring protein FliF/YscJ